MQGGVGNQHGPAKKGHGVWNWTATTAGPRNQKLAVIAIARDRPCNDTRGMLECAVSSNK